MDCIVHAVEKSLTQLSDFHFHSQGCQKLDKVAERWTLNTTSWDVSSLNVQYRRERFVAISSVQFISVTQSCPTLCDPMDCSMPGLPVHHQLPQFTQTHTHWVSDAIQPSHPLLPPSPPTFNLSQHQVFPNESVLHIRWPKYWSFSFSIRWPKYWSFSFSISPSNEYSGLISFRMDCLISSQSKRLSRVFSNTTVQKV